MAENHQIEAEQHIIESKQFDEPYIVGRNQLQVSQEPYFLTEADFVLIKHAKSWILVPANILLWSGVALGISIGARYLWPSVDVETQTPKVQVWEIAATVVTFTIGLILFLCRRFVPDDRKRLMKNIEIHFRGAKRYPMLLKEKGNE